MAQLDRELEQFVNAHADELDPHDVFIIGVAAGIISRVHNSGDPRLIDVELPAVRPE
jgi:hypothetical protein